jgi:predicted ATPase with chaperone activity
MLAIESAESSDAVRPLAPQSIEQTGLSLDMLVQLATKMLHFSGELTGTEFASRLGLPFQVIAPALEALKAQRHCEIAGGAMIGAASYRYRITDAGRERAVLFLSHNHYVGQAPVPVEQYRDYMERFAAGAARRANRERLRRAFSHLVISDRVLDQLGPAINSGHSMFVYGPPGNGKTVISQAIRNLLDGDIAIPHAIEAEGSIIRFLDPVNHEPRSERPNDQLDSEVRYDGRWVRCRRPLVMVGGELTLDQLEIRYSPTVGFYNPPIQAVANGGVLVIDDFGRQSCSPRDLLNRWIVPLESRTDHMTLQTGQKFEFPFMTMIVFATNIKPSELLDEAFLRRIHYKVYAESPTRTEFLQIFENCCREMGVEYRADVVGQMLDTYYEPRRLPMRGCHPRDLLDHARALSEYLDQPLELTPALLEAACAGYFVDSRAGSQISI